MYKRLFSKNIDLQWEKIWVTEYKISKLLTHVQANFKICSLIFNHAEAQDYNTDWKANSICNVLSSRWAVFTDFLNGICTFTGGVLKIIFVNLLSKM